MTKWKSMLLLAVAVGLAVGFVLALNVGQPAVAQGGGGGGGGGRGPSYSVVETEGHNLIVTDNKTNTLYFYTIDKDAKIGSDLKLRGSVDLTQVGKAVITPAKAKAE